MKSLSEPSSKCESLQGYITLTDRTSIAESSLKKLSNLIIVQSAAILVLGFAVAILVDDYIRHQTVEVTAFKASVFLLACLTFCFQLMIFSYVLQVGGESKLSCHNIFCKCQLVTRAVVLFIFFMSLGIHYVTGIPRD
jgi:hypothetical protein